MSPAPQRVSEEKISHTLILELALILFFSMAVFMLAAKYDFLERLVAISQLHEEWEIDELITVALFLVNAIAVFSIRRWIEFRHANAVLFQRNHALQEALIQIKELKGSIPICSACKKIRDGKGFWHQVESYIETHTHAEFTHGICPECTQKLYPEYVAAKNKK